MASRRYRRKRRRRGRLSPELSFFEQIGAKIGDALETAIRWVLGAVGLLRRERPPVERHSVPPGRAKHVYVSPFGPQSPRKYPHVRHRPREEMVALASPRPPGAPPGLPPFGGPDEPLPYRRTDHLLTKGERAFWHPLRMAVGDRYLIFCKVRLANIVCCPPARGDERRWFQKIGRYHVDFVVCDVETTRPLLVIELDDRRHLERPSRERDVFKDEVLRAAKMPLLRIIAQTAYDVAELRRQLSGTLSGERHQI